MLETAITRYVRVTGTKAERFVEFDFAIGDPDVYVELILPFIQFRQFCEQQAIVFMTDEQASQVDLDRLKWRYSQHGDSEH
ncbi:phenol hydroxylase subunit [Beggiatoa leptomitoformis]|uniref:Phenol hydroxylase n=1 Tax=Beggiatoa leptomitoformis TaxID=288004 RepID=A0A2N9YC49_9GAMM|nr:phenol hydroxylase subunit [Beggiatoa leptomitoformis]ALG66624.1 phenol hydroxylase [Beggiatoa leptomitoformis]AUI68065.1 phenol hydroxylase [Beggiatoa leptomitoformis]